MRHVTEVFRTPVVVLLPDLDGRLTVRGHTSAEPPPDSSETGVARWVFEHRQPAGLGTATLPDAGALYVPLLGPRGCLGVLGVRPTDAHAFDIPERLHQLETFAAQTALALERARLADEAGERGADETERLRNSLLSSVSHDLRTPIGHDHRRRHHALEQGGRLDLPPSGNSSSPCARRRIG